MGAHSIPVIVKDLNAHAHQLDELVSKIETVDDELPTSINAIKGNYIVNRSSRIQTVGEVVETAANAKKKINLYYERVQGALKKAVEFNDIVRKQHDYEHNKLPEEMYQSAGEVVS